MPETHTNHDPFAAQRRSLSRGDLLDPVKPAPPPPVLNQLVDILTENHFLNSTAAQPFILLDTVFRYNSFALPLNSRAIEDWLIQQYTSTGKPVPNLRHVRAATRVAQALSLTRSMGTWRQRFHIRLGYEPN